MSRPTRASAGECDRHEKRNRDLQPRRVQADGPSARFVHALEDDEDVVDADEPEGARRQDDPEAVHDGRSREKRDAEGQGLTGSNRPRKLSESEAQHDESHDNVDELPDLHLANADQQLCIARLRQCEVQRSQSNLLHQALHAGLNHQVYPASPRGRTLPGGQEFPLGAIRQAGTCARR